MKKLICVVGSMRGSGCTYLCDLIQVFLKEVRNTTSVKVSLLEKVHEKARSISHTWDLEYVRNKDTPSHVLNCTPREYVNRVANTMRKKSDRYFGEITCNHINKVTPEYVVVDDIINPSDLGWLCRLAKQEGCVVTVVHVHGPGESALDNPVMFEHGFPYHVVTHKNKGITQDTLSSICS